MCVHVFSSLLCGWFCVVIKTGSPYITKTGFWLEPNNNFTAYNFLRWWLRRDHRAHIGQANICKHGYSQLSDQCTHFVYRSMIQETYYLMRRSPRLVWTRLFNHRGRSLSIVRDLLESSQAIRCICTHRSINLGGFWRNYSKERTCETMFSELTLEGTSCIVRAVSRLDSII